jgi:MYXO-CTERM domain-containing protein
VDNVLTGPNRSLFSLVGLLLSVGLLGACGQATKGVPGGEVPDQIPNRTATQAIEGGEVEPDDKYIVGILSTNGGLCSGTLIAPNLVLTARHCVSALNERGGVDCESAEFTTDFPARDFIVSTDTSLVPQPEDINQVADIHHPPGGDGVCGRDIAMMELQNTISSSVTEPVAPALSDGSYAQGNQYSAIGYGHIGDGSGAGTRRILDGQQIYCYAENCQQYAASTEFIGDGGTCQGDSGGGAIRGGKVLGALSRGASGCNSSLYTATAGFPEWIRSVGQTAASNGSYPTPDWASTGEDSDGDGIADGSDNCPNKPNPDQSNADGDDQGDVCDADDDNDGVRDSVDNCPKIPNDEQTDTDGDGKGNVCDSDDDGDGVVDGQDNCPQTPNPAQVASDADGTGDACDDSDGDGVVDADDNCPSVPNGGQADRDEDGVGDACDEPETEPDAGMPDTGTGGGSDDELNWDTQASAQGSGCSAAGSSGSSPLPVSMALVLLGFGALRRVRGRRHG